MATRQTNPWPALEPGKLRHQIQIQSQSSSQDSYGQLQQTWATIRTSWASIQSLILKEAFQADSLTSQVTHLITLRWPSGVSIQAGMRVVYGSHTYKIQAVNNIDERNVILKLLVMELNAIE